MTGQLNTTVNGSPGTCVEGASWFKELRKAASMAADEVNSAEKVRHAKWYGPASFAYHSSMDGVRDTCDDLAFTAEKYARGLDDFASALNKVFDRMFTARAEAQAGGLEVQGPFILPPKPIGPGPQPPKGTFTVGEADVAFRSFQNDMQDYTADVSEYNRKVRVFNKCSELVQDARNREDEAHADLRDALAAPPNSKVDRLSIGTTTAAKLIGYIGTVENARYNALLQANRLAADTKTFQQFAMGTLATVNAKEAALLRMAGDKAGPGQSHYLKRVGEFEKYIKGVPERVRTWAAAYPGKAKVTAPNAPAHHKAAGVVAKRMPFVGSTLVAFSEARGAWKGEQTWEKAIARTGGTLAGAGVGAKLGAMGGSFLGPAGTIVGTIAGGTVGAIGGQEVVDFFMPDETNKQPTAQAMEAPDASRERFNKGIEYELRPGYKDKIEGGH